MSGGSWVRSVLGRRPQALCPPAHERQFGVPAAGPRPVPRISVRVPDVLCLGGPVRHDRIALLGRARPGCAALRCSPLPIRGMCCRSQSLVRLVLVPRPYLTGQCVPPRVGGWCECGHQAWSFPYETKYCLGHDPPRVVEPAHKAQVGHLTRAEEITCVLVVLTQRAQVPQLARAERGRGTTARRPCWCLLGHGASPLVSVMVCLRSARTRLAETDTAGHVSSSSDLRCTTLERRCSIGAPPLCYALCAWARASRAAHCRSASSSVARL